VPETSGKSRSGADNWCGISAAYPIRMFCPIKKNSLQGCSKLAKVKSYKIFTGIIKVL
jgi:hypothetical protein